MNNDKEYLKYKLDNALENIKTYENKVFEPTLKQNDENKKLKECIDEMYGIYSYILENISKYLENELFFENLKKLFFNTIGLRSYGYIVNIGIDKGIKVDNLQYELSISLENALIYLIKEIITKEINYYSNTYKKLNPTVTKYEDNVYLQKNITVDKNKFKEYHNIFKKLHMSRDVKDELFNAPTLDNSISHALRLSDLFEYNSNNHKINISIYAFLYLSLQCYRNKKLMDELNGAFNVNSIFPDNFINEIALELDIINLSKSKTKDIKYYTTDELYSNILNLYIENYKND